MAGYDNTNTRDIVDAGDGLLQQVVTRPARDRQTRGVHHALALLPTDLDQHALHHVGDLVVAHLHVDGGVAMGFYR